MNLSWYRHLVFTITAGSLFLIGSFLLLNVSQTAHADPSDLFVTAGGTGDCSQAAPCDRQAALSTATDGDALYFAGGTYTGGGSAVITITRNITLYGGWDGAASGAVIRDPGVYTTTLDGQGQRRVIYIGSGISPTVDGFLIGNGNAAGLGGGHFSGSDAGGGIYSDGAAPIIQNNVITNNVGSTQAGARAFGGGIYINAAPTTAVVRQNQILSNTAGIDIHLGDGGGLFFDGSVHVLSNVFRGNSGCVSCTGQGGGVQVGWTQASAGARIAGNTFADNRANYGGGIDIVWSAVEVTGNTLTGNQAGWGGGIYAYYDGGSFIDANRMISNAADLGGGMAVNITLLPFTSLSNNVLARNQASTGGGLYAWSDWHVAAITLTHNTFVDNGEGVIFGHHVTATLTNNVFASHTLAISRTESGSKVTVDHALFWANDDDGLRGVSPVDGNPDFADDDYHIGAGSAAIDAGVDAGVTTDIDGDSRPGGAGYDIGADEFYEKVYLPLVLRAYP